VVTNCDHLAQLKFSPVHAFTEHHGGDRPELPSGALSQLRYNPNMYRAPNRLRPLEWIGNSKKDLQALPQEVMHVFGYALYLAQVGGKHDQAKPLRGFGSAGVLEVAEDWRGNAYRAVYTVRFEEIVFVLHVFQKKSKSGITTPKQEMDLIERRLKVAAARVKELRNEQAQGK